MIYGAWNPIGKHWAMNESGEPIHHEHRGIMAARVKAFARSKDYEIRAIGDDGEPMLPEEEAAGK